MDPKRTLKTNATPFDDDERPPLPGSEAGELISKGKTLVKAGTPFVTAITVQKPRDMDLIVENIEKEAQYAGEKFWYRLPFGQSKIEGPTIGLATSLLREWGNNAVTMDTQETDDAFYFTPRYIDLEKGVQLERSFRQRKNQSTGKMDSDRAVDIAFQIGQSKAIRNVILNALPKWLISRAIAAAKAAVAAGITPEKLQATAKAAVDFFASLGVSQEQLEAHVDRKRVEWTSEDLADLRAAREALISKEASIEELFPREAKEQKGPAGPAKAEDLGKAIAEELPQSGKPGEPSAAEKKAIEARAIAESKAFQCAKCVSPEIFGADTMDELNVHMKTKHGASGTPSAVQDPKKKPSGGAGKF